MSVMRQPYDRRGLARAVLSPVLVLVLGVVAGGCGAGQPRVSPPPTARLVPSTYHIRTVYRANLSGGPTPDLVVISTSPAASRFPHDDLQVISWIPGRRVWAVVFDAQKTAARIKPAAPHESNKGPGFGPYLARPSLILDRTSDTEQWIDQVRFAPLLGLRRDQLAFTFTNVAGGGMHGILVIVDLSGDVSNVLYVWEGDTGLASWRIADNVIHATANYMAPYDSECCPVRTYRFALAAHGGHIIEVSDDRPFLGVLVNESGVIRAAPHTPAAGHLRAGDVILALENAPKPGPNANPVTSGWIFDQLARFHAGQTARLLVQRRGRRLTESIKLGSMASPAAETLRIPMRKVDGYDLPAASAL